MKTFKQIHIFSCFDFDFDHTGLPAWQGAVGPWRKVSPRKCVKISDPSTEYRVGSINTAVISRMDLHGKPVKTA